MIAMLAESYLANLIAAACVLGGWIIVGASIVSHALEKLRRTLESQQNSRSENLRNE